MHLVSLAAVLAVAAWTSPAAAQAANGEAAYRDACASCHRTPARVVRRYLDLAPQQRQSELDRFLTGHHAPDEAQRGAIIAWLEANHRRR